MAVGSVVSGQVTLGGSAVQVATDLDGVLSIEIKCLESNTNPIYIGPSSVTSANGHEVSPGVAQGLDYYFPSHIYVIGTPGDKFSYLVIRNV